MEKEELIKKLYLDLINCWNERNALGFSELFRDNGNVIGFDGSQLDGKSGILEELTRIFRDHQTAPFTTIIREIRFITENVAVLRAVSGMVLPGEKNIHEEANAIQSLVTVKENDEWKITLFQNTPAQFHGRDDLYEKLTEELQEAYINKQNQK